MGVGIEPAARRVVIGPRARGAVHEVSLRNMNWLIPPPEEDLRCMVQIRAREEVRAATVRRTVDGALVTLDEPAMPAPGQACVLYDGSRVLGGGFIRRREPVASSFSEEKEAKRL